MDMSCKPLGNYFPAETSVPLPRAGAMGGQLRESPRLGFQDQQHKLLQALDSHLHGHNRGPSGPNYRTLWDQTCSGVSQGHTQREREIALTEFIRGITIVLITSFQLSKDLNLPGLETMFVHENCHSLKRSDGAEICNGLSAYAGRRFWSSNLHTFARGHPSWHKACKHTRECSTVAGLYAISHCLEIIHSLIYTVLFQRQKGCVYFSTLEKSCWPRHVKVAMRTAD